MEKSTINSNAIPEKLGYASLTTKSSGYKNHYEIVKAIIVKDRDKDPLKMDRYVIYIPAYHTKDQKSKADSEKESEDNKAGLPYAQLCTLDFKQGPGNNVFASKSATVSTTGKTTTDMTTSGCLGKRTIGSKTENNIPIIYPEVGDTVWVAFEGGDVRNPVILGSVATTVKGIQLSAGASGSGGASGDLALLALEVIMSEETSGQYAVVNWGWDIDAVSCGPLQWNRTRFQELMQVMYNADPQAFQNACGDAGFASACQSGSVPVYFGAGSAYGTALKKAIGTSDLEDTSITTYHDPPTDVGKKGFEELAKKDIGGYISRAKELGLTDNPAICMFCSCYNQSPAGADNAASAAVSAGKADLDGFYNVTLSTEGLGGSANYLSPRRTREYNMIKEMVAQGRFNALSGSGGNWLWPTPGVYLITSLTGIRDSPGGIGSTNHGGIDIAGPVGSQIIATTDGTITLASYNGGFGNCIIMQPTNGGDVATVTHGHLSGYNCSVGQTVTAGSVIGFMGNTGNSTGSHLHFEFRDANGGRLDPLKYVQMPAEVRIDESA